MQTASQPKLTIRPMTEKDVKDVLRIDRDAAAQSGAEGARWVVPPNKMMSWLKRRKEPGPDVWETRALVVEESVLCEDAQTGESVEVEWPCGACVYELRPERLEALGTFLSPYTDRGPVLAAICDYLKRKAAASTVRRRVVVHLRDREGVDLAFLLPEYRKQGFKLSLIRDHFKGRDPHDAWRLTFETGA
jgi:hypothetical protein